jgi:cytochrome c-type biogenesis protein CcmH
MNLTFIALAGALTLLAVALVVWPIWRTRQPGDGGTVLSIAMVVLGIPLAVLGIVPAISTYPWDAPERVTAQPVQDPPRAVTEMVQGLAARMATAPTVEGLAMLGRSYVELQRYAEAVDTWHAAWELAAGADPQVSLGYAEALILANRETLLTSAGDLLDAVLLELPDEPRALWYGGLSSAARQRPGEAQARWGKLLQDPELPPQLRQVLEQQMAALSGAAVPPGATAATPPAAGSLRTIEATIALSPALAEEAGAGMLFVIAREAGQPGPPVAVQRVPVDSFPQVVTLSDDNVMLPGRSLANIRNLELTARLSASGDAIAASGDLFGVATPGLGDSATLRVNLLIDSVQP